MRDAERVLESAEGELFEQVGVDIDAESRCVGYGHSAILDLEAGPRESVAQGILGTIHLKQRFRADQTSRGGAISLIPAVALVDGFDSGAAKVGTQKLNVLVRYQRLSGASRTTAASPVG